MGFVVRTGDHPCIAAVAAQVAPVLSAGGVAVFPTDTVYGISQSVRANPDGPRRLFAIKRRDLAKVVPWLVGSPDDLARYGRDVPPYALRLAERFWPGGLTLVVPASGEVPAAYRAVDGTVALRMPDAPLVLEIVRRTESPLATTSANTSGLPAPTDCSQLEGRIAAEADVVVDGGPTPDGCASTVVACTGGTPAVVRPGAVSERRIMEAVR